MYVCSTSRLGMVSWPSGRAGKQLRTMNSHGPSVGVIQLCFGWAVPSRYQIYQLTPNVSLSWCQLTACDCVNVAYAPRSTQPTYLRHARYTGVRMYVCIMYLHAHSGAYWRRIWIFACGCVVERSCLYTCVGQSIYNLHCDANVY